MNYDKAQPELDLLVRIIERHPEGVSAEEVRHESGLALQRRSLQRRLASLVEQGRIRVQGQARAVRYFPVLEDESAGGVGTSSAEAATEPYVPVSPEGEAIKAYVRQPRHLRKPVVYRTEFLEQYHPNHSGRIQVQVQHLFSALNQPGSLAAASAAHRPPGEWSNPRSSWGAR